MEEFPTCYQQLDVPLTLIPYIRLSEVPASRRNLSAGLYSVGAKLPFLPGDPETLKALYVREDN